MGVGPRGSPVAPSLDDSVCDGRWAFGGAFRRMTGIACVLFWLFPAVVVSPLQATAGRRLSPDLGLPELSHRTHPRLGRLAPKPPHRERARAGASVLACPRVSLYAAGSHGCCRSLRESESDSERWFTSVGKQVGASGGKEREKCARASAHGGASSRKESGASTCRQHRRCSSSRGACFLRWLAGWLAG